MNAIVPNHVARRYPGAEVPIVDLDAPAGVANDLAPIDEVVRTLNVDCLIQPGPPDVQNPQVDELVAAGYGEIVGSRGENALDRAVRTVVSSSQFRVLNADVMRVPTVSPIHLDDIVLNPRAIEIDSID